MRVGVGAALVALPVLASVAMTIAARLPTNHDPRNFTPALNGSHLIEPKDPPGFSVLIDLDDSSRIFLPEHVYLIAIAVVTEWAFEGWNEVIPARTTRPLTRSHGLFVRAGSIAHPEWDKQLIPGYLILGMLHLIDQMIKVRKFSQGLAYVFMGKDGLGYMDLRALQPSQTNGLLTKIAAVNDTKIDELNAATSMIVDPQDSSFAVTYEVETSALTCVDLLSTILYAIATAAQGESDEFCQHLGGLNEKQSAFFQINGRRPTPSMHLLNYYAVMRGLSMLAPTLYDKGTCGEMHFSFLYNGDVLGGGVIELR
ncbi:MAG: hypothetical protein Q9220_004399 [cf. Caloplaca sp. 1 TL-2023]